MLRNREYMFKDGFCSIHVPLIRNDDYLLDAINVINMNRTQKIGIP